METSMTTFRTSREIAAPLNQVFAAFSDTQRLARWWGPAGFTNTFNVCEFKSGGRWSFVMHGPDGPDPGYWAPPSGKIESGEGQEAAVIREVKEELGVTIRPVRKVWECISAGAAHTLHWWLADAEDRELRPDRREASDARWVAV